MPPLCRAALLTHLLAAELGRMKEKDRLRKEYVEELRKRHEEEASRLEAQLAKEQRARREEQAARIEVIPPESESAPNICLVPAQAPLFTFALCVCSQHDDDICVLCHKLQVERELERAKRDLKKELDHLRSITEQDRAHRDRFELCKKKLKDIAETVETLHTMGADLEDSTNHMKVRPQTVFVARV
jgi:prefoldin subunit 5